MTAAVTLNDAANHARMYGGVLDPAAPWPTLAEVDEAIATGKVLTELQARADLASRRHGPRPDQWWAARWRWAPGDVHDLRTTNVRERDELPFPAYVRASRDREREQERWRR